MITTNNNKVSSTPVISLKTDTVMKDWYKRSVLMGEAHSLDHIANYHSCMNMDVRIRYLGGLYLALEFRYSADAKEYLEDNDRWKEWFKWLKDGERDGLRFERMAWLKIVGLPLRLWDEENFSRIVGNFGRVVNPFDAIYNRKDLSTGKVGIITSRRNWINEELTVMVDGEMFKIGVVEYTGDWSPFKSYPFDKTADSDDDDQESDEEDDESEGVSDAWMADRQDEEEFEEGEITPEQPGGNDDENNKVNGNGESLGISKGGIEGNDGGVDACDNVGEVGEAGGPPENEVNDCVEPDT